MKETYYMGAYWGARGESPGACAERCSKMMTELATCHELVASWNHKALTFHEALKRKLVTTRESLEPLFEPYEPDDPEPMGYRFSCWNGQRQRAKSMELSMSCGGLIDVPTISNNVVLTMPDISDAVASLYEPDRLLRILRAIVSAWDPDWAVLMSRAYRDEYAYPDDDARPPGKPYVGWMTYLRARRLQSLIDEPPCEVIDVPERGSIFVVTRAHRFSVENADDIERAQELAEFLEASDALVPIPPDEPF